MQETEYINVYGARVHNLSFQIPQNTTTAIVGPSGSGKSTICNLKLLRDDRGSFFNRYGCS